MTEQSDEERITAALLAELNDAEAGWDREDSDWTEDLFHRSRIYIESLIERLRATEAERDHISERYDQAIIDLANASLDAYKARQEVAARDAVISEVERWHRGAQDTSLGTILSAAPASVLREHDAEVRERALKNALAEIVKDAPPVNAELTLTPAGVVEDKGMAAYVEGMHDAWAAVNSMIITESAYRAGADQ